MLPKCFLKQKKFICSLCTHTIMKLLALSCNRWNFFPPSLSGDKVNGFLKGRGGRAGTACARQLVADKIMGLDKHGLGRQCKSCPSPAFPRKSGNRSRIGSLKHLSYKNGLTLQNYEKITQVFWVFIAVAFFLWTFLHRSLQI